MKIVQIIVLTTLFIIFANIASANIINVPNILSAPLVLFDDGGNPLQDGDYTATIQLKDSFGSILYEEEQEITVSSHIAPLIIGQGFVVGSNFSSPTGGLSKEIFDVDGDVTVDIQVDGLLSSQEIAILTSQPYAFISDYALSTADESVTTFSIQDGTILAGDLDPNFLTDLQTIAAASVPLSEGITLNYSESTTVEGALVDFDGVLSTLDSHTNDFNNPHNVTYTQTGAAAASHNHDSSYVNVTGDTMTGDLSLGGNDLSSVGTLQMTGLAGGSPNANTLYKNNMVLAWARVKANFGGTPSFTSSFNFASVTRSPGFCDYKLTFINAPTSSTTYVATANVENSSSDDIVVIKDTQSSSLTLKIYDMNNVPGACSALEDFHVMVVGY